MPNDHLEYGTRGTPRRAALRVADFRQHHRSTRVELSKPGFGHALDLDCLGGPEGVAGLLEAGDAHLGQFDQPVAGLEAGCEVRCSRDNGVDDVQPRGQGRIELGQDVNRIAFMRETNFDVLGFTGRPGGSGVRVGDLRMRGETSAVGDGEARSPNGAFECALEITMAGKAQPTASGVTQPNSLRDRRDVAIRWTT